MPVGANFGLTPIAKNGAGQERQVTGSTWSLMTNPTGDASLHISPSIQFAACLHAVKVGFARVTCKGIADGKSLTGTLDIQIVVLQ